MISGIAFIIIGAASLIDSNIPRKVELDKTLNPNVNNIDVVTPIMNKGSVGKIIVDGSKLISRSKAQTVQLSFSLLIVHTMNTTSLLTVKANLGLKQKI